MAADSGSLSKEPPLAKLDATIEAITPSMPYNELLETGRTQTHRDAPGLVRKRFLLVDANDRIVYDRFLSLANTEGLNTSRIRKVMYFAWAYRDERLRRFICERIANPAGKWRVSELTKKTNAEFFEQWFEGSTAKKVRSNIEYFFVEAGIYKQNTRSVHLELDDGWLPEAMQVAAQHEKIPARRRAMASAPLQFLVAQGWQGLANATADELLGLDKRVPAAVDPLEDEEIAAGPTAPASPRTWEPHEPSASSRQPTTVLVNHVARERASASHQMLERAFAQVAGTRGYVPQCNANIDMYFPTPNGTALAEMKSCHQGNLHSQVRRGVSQLLEYRFVYRDVLDAPVTLILLLEARPSAEKLWLANYLQTVGVTLAWKDRRGDRIATATAIPPALDGLISPDA